MHINVHPCVDPCGFGSLLGSLQRLVSTTLLLSFFTLTRCAGVNVVMLSAESFPPEAHHIQALEREPTRPYVQIAILSLDSLWLSEDSRREKILEKAGTLGADAVIFGDLRLRPQNESNRPDTQVSPSPSSPPVQDEKPISDDLHSSLQQPRSGDDVKIVLARGSRGGGRGPGGYRGWGGRRPWGPYYRPWGGYYGPSWGYYGPYYGPWGYGFAPGLWGYGPYGGGGYYNSLPYSAYGAYPGYGYGYVNTVTVGTAIRYTK